MSPEVARVLGKREMLWNFQRQLKALKIKGKEINEENINKIILLMAQLQDLEETNYETLKYIDSDIDADIRRNSIYMLMELK